MTVIGGPCMTTMREGNRDGDDRDWGKSMTTMRKGNKDVKDLGSKPKATTGRGRATPRTVIPRPPAGRETATPTTPGR